uniref:Uncharacterized protein n=1 Tax=Heterorhabditis bacteriophora TaxID=37862 RepID=A0A1I7WHP3_HETBA
MNSNQVLLLWATISLILYKYSYFHY